MRTEFKDLSGFLKTSVVLLWILIGLYAAGILAYAFGLTV